MAHQTRRDFFSTALLASLLPALDCKAAVGSNLNSIIQSAQQQIESNDATAEFWTNYVRQAPWRTELASPNYKLSKKSKRIDKLLTNVREQSELLGIAIDRPPDRVNPTIFDAQLAPEFFIYTDDKGFKRARDITNEELIDKGDVQVVLRVTGFRPSRPDRTTFTNIVGGYLRLDVQQLVAPPTLAEALAWTALATFAPTAKALPATTNFNFDPGTVWGKSQSITLPKGFGSWTWNFSVQEKESLWRQIADIFIKFRTPLVTGLLTPLGLPAIALTAFTTFDALYGSSLAKNAGNIRHLFQSQDKSLIATRSALTDSFLPGGPDLKLRSGTYVIVARKHADAFAAAMSDHKVVGGFVIKKNETNEVAGAENAIENVTYLTVAVGVRPAPTA